MFFLVPPVYVSKFSLHEFHSQIVRLKTFNNVVENLSKMENCTLPYRVRRRLMNTTKSLVANICGGIYVEFLIQRSAAEGKISGPLTWILANPADGNGTSMYVGLDISTKRSVTRAAFVLLDPIGELIDAKKIQLRSEVLQYQDYYDILRYMISKARDRGLKRIVMLRDGIPRSSLELEDCLTVLNRVMKELKYRILLDYVAVIKGARIRVFASSGEEKANPIQGTYMYMYKLRHLGYYAHEILVTASRPEESIDGGGTVRPIILRVYELQREYSMDEVKRIAREYLALTRLDFWNLWNGASRLALPVKMADILSYMLSMGIPIKI